MIPPTRESIFDHYREGGDAARRAVTDWFNSYRAPLCQFVRCHFPTLAAEAEDVVQGFVMDKVLIGERSLLMKYRPERGRFRTYLQVALKRYCLSVLKAKRRRGTHLSLDESIDSPCPEEIDPFDVLWARQVAGRTFRRVKRACDANPKLAGVWGIVKGRILGPLRGKHELAYEEICMRFGYKAPNYAQKDMTEARRMLVEAKISVVSEYVGADAAASELMDLWRVIRRIREARERGSDGCSPGESNKE